MFYETKMKGGIVLTDILSSFMKLNLCVFMATLGNAHLEVNGLNFALLI